MRHKHGIRIFFFIAIVLSLAYSIGARANSKIEVFYFAGYGASDSYIKCWEKGARQKTPYKDHYSFKGFAYPAGASWRQDSAIDGARAEIEAVLKYMNSQPEKKFIIVGHSSGSAIANRVASLVKNPSRIELIDLDGFRPLDEVKNRVGRYTCWAGRGLGVGAINQSSMESCGKPGYREMKLPHCESRTCTHYSLVTVGGGSYGSGCDPNLGWLKLADHPGAS